MGLQFTSSPIQEMRFPEHAWSAVIGLNSVCQFGHQCFGWWLKFALCFSVS